jgi:hypothetical protein
MYLPFDIRIRTVQHIFFGNGGICTVPLRGIFLVLINVTCTSAAIFMFCPVFFVSMA